MRVLIVYFSFTSNVRILADSIRAELETTCEVRVAAIEPKKRRGYWRWLVRSFLPGWRVPIKETLTDLEPYELVLLGFPKWTLNCPPVNQYLKIMKGSGGKKFGLFMSYGGFDEERYMRSMTKRVCARGAHIVATLSVRRNAIREGTYQDQIRSFCAQALTWRNKIGKTK